MLSQLTSQSGAALFSKSGVESRSTVVCVDNPGSRLANRLCLAGWLGFGPVLCGRYCEQSGFCASPSASCVLPWRDDGLCRSPNKCRLSTAQSLTQGHRESRNHGRFEPARRCASVSTASLLRDNIHNPRETARAEPIKPFVSNHQP
ncbi:hypothetical protein CORC01_13867 [Colletotrichum orchidophilum]|uniref:Uncharacterized protein n=1 Tax=Colletotrichum orchidophilum TaxID=1209926 RepID=A0A1G4AP40_9PEZI|nr:uncharacterized protein CORC01_13867 [Colletotrichum orchidophilum]OHE90823.1 hypothetical protein CORC01_13867 [Colletotrichum orchidophilum]